MLDLFYIEDDPNIASVVKEYLEQKNFKVTICMTLAQARQILNERVPTLVLLDWNMPDGHGDGLCQWIRSKWKKMPIVFLTVRGESADIVSGFRNGADDFEDAEDVQRLAEVESAIVYQKAAAKRMITEEEVSEEMKAFGGFTHASGNYVTQTDGGWLVNAPVVILDDDSFLAYCEQLGITPQLDGAVILNQIRDVTNPDFRHPVYMSYVNENTTTVLRQSGNEEMTVEIPVFSYTKEAPVLKEEYAKIDYYELVHFISISEWKEVKGQIGGSEEDCYICVKAKEDVTLEELNMLQNEIASLLGGKYTIEQENRIQEYETNENQIQGMMIILGGFCTLLSIIGIGNVFSNTLGFVRQRKREFARYMSVGLTPKELKKMFCTEALVIAGKPILISLPLVLIAVGYLLRTSYVEVGSGKFYSEYRAYCARVGDFTRSTTEFYNAVEQAGFKRVKKKHSMWILGLRLLEGDFAVRGSKPGARFTVADVKDCMQQKEQEIQKESAKPHPKHHMKPMMNFRRNTKFQRMTIPSFTVRHLMISIRNGREEMLYQIK